MWVQIPLPAPSEKMSTSTDFIDYVMDNLNYLPSLRYKKMFGDYALYYKEKVIALICDNQFFLKPTEPVKKIINNLVEQSPFKGSKLWFLIEDIENPQVMCNLIESTHKNLPDPKQKKARKKNDKHKR